MCPVIHVTLVIHAILTLNAASCSSASSLQVAKSGRWTGSIDVTSACHLPLGGEQWPGMALLHATFATLFTDCSLTGQVGIVARGIIISATLLS